MLATKNGYFFHIHLYTISVFAVQSFESLQTSRCVIAEVELIRVLLGMSYFVRLPRSSTRQNHLFTMI